jgi:hypothetical protein
MDHLDGGLDPGDGRRAGQPRNEANLSARPSSRQLVLLTREVCVKPDKAAA